jgi:hypothetical protein
MSQGIALPTANAQLPVTTFTEASDWFSFHEDEASLEEQDQAALETCWGPFASGKFRNWAILSK